MWTPASGLLLQEMDSANALATRSAVGGYISDLSERGMTIMGLMTLIQRRLRRSQAIEEPDAAQTGLAVQQRVDALTEEQTSEKLDKLRSWFSLLHEAQQAADTLLCHLQPVGGLPPIYGDADERRQLESWCAEVTRACQRISPQELNRLDDLLYYSPAHRAARGRAPVADDELREIVARWQLAVPELEAALAVADQNTRLARALWERVSANGDRVFNIEEPAFALARALQALTGALPFTRLETPRNTR